MQYDDSEIEPMSEEEYTDHMAEDSNYSVVDWRQKKNPLNHWCIPFVTGHKYYLRWEYGLDFDTMLVERVNWLWN